MPANSRGRTSLSAVVLAAAVGLVPAQAHAQQPTDSLRAEVRSLRSAVDSLEAALVRLQARGALAPAAPAAEQLAVAPADTSDQLARIRAAAQAAAAQGAEAQPADTGAATAPPQFVGHQRNLSVFNPEISATGDLFTLANTAGAGNDQNFIPREFELALQSNLDPYSRAKVFVAYHQPGGEILPFPEAPPEAGTEVDVEEGYVEWVNIPGGLGLTLGKFRQRFGTLNRWHAHALPAQMLPLPYLAFFGEEGLAQTGGSLHWLAPAVGPATFEVWGQLTRSNNDALFGDDHGLSGLVHLNTFLELSPATYLELGLSGLTGRYQDPAGTFSAPRRVGGADVTLSWRPPRRSLYREATLRGGVVFDRLATDAPTDAWGAFAIGEYRLNQRWLAGLRYEYTEDPFDPSRHANLVAPTLTWWQSEFVRVRLEYDHLDRPGPAYRPLLIQTTFAMGPHKHETY